MIEFVLDADQPMCIECVAAHLRDSLLNPCGSIQNRLWKRRKRVASPFSPMLQFRRFLESSLVVPYKPRIQMKPTGKRTTRKEQGSLLVGHTAALP